MKVPLSWIREFVDVTASAEEIGTLMGVRGLALEGLEPHGDDVVMDFDVTANRPDCMSVIGIAREIATAYRLPLRNGPADGNSPAKAGRYTANGAVPITIEEPELCCRYVGAVADVTVGPSPKWMQDRLDDVRRAADQQHRRHHQLRDARARPADARVRSREDAPGQDRRAPRQGRASR